MLIKARFGLASLLYRCFFKPKKFHQKIKLYFLVKFLNVKIESKQARVLPEHKKIYLPGTLESHLGKLVL